MLSTLTVEYIKLFMMAMNQLSPYHKTAKKNLKKKRQKQPMANS